MQPVAPLTFQHAKAGMVGAGVVGVVGVVGVAGVAVGMVGVKEAPVGADAVCWAGLYCRRPIQ